MGVRWRAREEGDAGQEASSGPVAQLNPTRTGVGDKEDPEDWGSGGRGGRKGDTLKHSWHLQKNGWM